MVLPGLVYDLNCRADAYQVSVILQNSILNYSVTPAGFVGIFHNRKILSAGSGVDQLHQLTLQVGYTMDL